jgi:DNA modification methylase
VNEVEPIELRRPLGDDPPTATLFYGASCIETLRQLADGSVHCAVTSPPYWGLRDYEGDPQVWGGDLDCEHEWGEMGPEHHPGQVEQTKWKTADAAGKGQTAGSGQLCRRCDAWLGQFGLEPTPQLFVEHLVEIFRELRRVLRDDGTFWLNLGDSYAGSNAQQGGDGSSSRLGERATNTEWSREQQAMRTQGGGISKTGGGLKPKDLCGIPWRVAFALQDDGWYLRSDIIWAKGNPMPESVRDRVTRAHEYVFMLTKRPRYFYDADAIKVADSGRASKNRGRQTNHQPGHATFGTHVPWESDGSGRNKRSVWHVNPKPYKGAHFAVFPTELVEPCVLAGTSERGCCPMCGTPWERETERVDKGYDGSRYGERGAAATGGAITGGTKMSTLGSSGGTLTGEQRTVGWHPGCGCPAHEPVPCTVLDPFSGSGTTGVVALDNGRAYVGLDINEEYADLAVARLLGEDAPSRADDDDGGGILELLGVQGE